MKTTLSHLQALTYASQVAKHLVGIDINHCGANRHRQYEILTLGSGAITPRTLLTAWRYFLALNLIINQRINQTPPPKLHGATNPATAPIRAALGTVLFTPETEEAIPAVTGFNDDCGFVYEFHESTLCAWRIN